MGALDKLGNCPFASLMATIIVFVGVGVFCGTLYRALQIIIINVMEGLFQFSVSWLSVVQIVFIVIGVVMALFSIVLLVLVSLQLEQPDRMFILGRDVSWEEECLQDFYGHVLPVEPSVAGDSWCGHHSCLFVCYVGFYL